MMNLKATLLLLVMGWSGPAISQYKNIMLDEQAEGPDICAPTIVINPRRPANIVASAVPNRSYYSKDAGATWQKQTVSSADDNLGEPMTISDPKGVFYYLHPSNPATADASGKGKPDRIVIQRSDDGGATWSPGSSVGLNHPKNQTGEWATTDDRGNLYVTWREFEQHGDPDADCASNILFSMSKNGKKWTDPAVISQVAGNCLDDGNRSRAAVPAVTPEGKVMIAWSNQGKIYLDRSFNGGEVWLRNDIEVAEQVGGSNLVIPGHGSCNGMPVLLADKSKSLYRGSLYLVWADQRKGEDDTDIWFTRSHNFGDNWSSPTRVNNDAGGKHQYLPWMAVDETTGYLYIVYYDRRNHDDLRTDVYLAHSTDGGATFKNTLISESPFTPDGTRTAEANSISAHGGVIIPAWTRTDDGKTSLWTAVIRHEELK